MNKELREDLEHLIICKDKTITPDLRDDVKMTLDYIDELENKIDKAIEYIEDYKHEYYYDLVDKKEVLNILRGEDSDK